MLSPLIGISTSIITVDKDPERAYVNTAYLRAIQDAGGIPVLLPPQLDETVLSVLWKRLDGLVLTGGGDIDPARFGEERHHATCEVSAARDASRSASSTGRSTTTCPSSPFAAASRSSTSRWAGASIRTSPTSTATPRIRRASRSRTARRSHATSPRTP